MTPRGAVGPAPGSRFYHCVLGKRRGTKRSVRSERWLAAAFGSPATSALGASPAPPPRSGPALPALPCAPAALCTRTEPCRQGAGPPYLAVPGGCLLWPLWAPSVRAPRGRSLHPSAPWPPLLSLAGPALTSRPAPSGGGGLGRGRGHGGCAGGAPPLLPPRPLLFYPALSPPPGCQVQSRPKHRLPSAPALGLTS